MKKIENVIFAFLSITSPLPTIGFCIYSISLYSDQYWIKIAPPTSLLLCIATLFLAVITFILSIVTILSKKPTNQVYKIYSNWFTLFTFVFVTLFIMNTSYKKELVSQSLFTTYFSSHGTSQITTSFYNTYNTELSRLSYFHYRTLFVHDVLFLVTMLWVAFFAIKEYFTPKITRVLLKSDSPLECLNDDPVFVTSGFDPLGLSTNINKSKKSPTEGDKHKYVIFVNEGDKPDNTDGVTKKIESPRKCQKYESNKLNISSHEILSQVQPVPNNSSKPQYKIHRLQSLTHIESNESKKESIGQTHINYTLHTTEIQDFAPDHNDAIVISSLGRKVRRVKRKKQKSDKDMASTQPIHRKIKVETDENDLGSTVIMRKSQGKSPFIDALSESTDEKYKYRTSTDLDFTSTSAYSRDRRYQDAFSFDDSDLTSRSKNDDEPSFTKYNHPSLSSSASKKQDEISFADSDTEIKSKKELSFAESSEPFKPNKKEISFAESEIGAEIKKDYVISFAYDLPLSKGKDLDNESLRNNTALNISFDDEDTKNKRKKSVSIVDYDSVLLKPQHITALQSSQESVGLKKTVIPRRNIRRLTSQPVKKSPFDFSTSDDDEIQQPKVNTERRKRLRSKNKVTRESAFDFDSDEKDEDETSIMREILG